MLSVKFSSEPVPGSPFECRIIDSQQLRVSGGGVKMCPVSLPTDVVINSSAGNAADCVINVHSPGGEILQLSVKSVNGTQQEVEYIPVEVGAHHVHVMLDGQPVMGSPYTCNAYDVGKVIVSGIDKHHEVGEPVRNEDFMTEEDYADCFEKKVKKKGNTKGC